MMNCVQIGRFLLLSLILPSLSLSLSLSCPSVSPPLSLFSLSRLSRSCVTALRSLSVVRGSPNPQREQRTFHVTSMFFGNVAASILPLWAVLQAPGKTKSEGVLLSAAAGLFHLVTGEGGREGEGQGSMALAWILAVIGLVINPLFFFMYASRYKRGGRSMPVIVAQHGRKKQGKKR